MIFKNGDLIAVVKDGPGGGELAEIAEPVVSCRVVGWSTVFVGKLRFEVNGGASIDGEALRIVPATSEHLEAVRWRRVHILLPRLWENLNHEAPLEQMEALVEMLEGMQWGGLRP